MAHTYLLFDFGADEEKAQQARHKLEGWKQAFRLDKKLLYKLDRGESPAPASPAAPSTEPETPAQSAKSAAKSAKGEKAASKSSSKSKEKSSSAEAPSAAPSSNAPVTLLVRLYFSGHEKLTEQRWLDRIPSEEPFKDASPKVVRQGQPGFDQLVDQFDSLT